MVKKYAWLVLAFLAISCSPSKPEASDAPGNGAPESESRLAAGGIPQTGSSENPVSETPSAPNPSNPVSPSTVAPQGGSSNPARAERSGQPSARRPYRPELPKADETVENSYSSGGTKVEIEGGCHITEDSIVCWKQDGSGHPELVQRIKDSFARDQGNGFSRIQFRYGRKNRVIVFKTTQEQMANRRGGGYVTVSQLGDDFGASFINLQLNDEMNMNRQPNQPFVCYEARYISVEPSETTTSARLSVTEMEPENPSLEAKVGASAKIAGSSFTIQSIEPFVEDRTMGYRDVIGNGKAWRIVLKRTGDAARRVMVGAMPRDEKGVQIAYTNSKGDPVDYQEYSKAMNYDPKNPRGFIEAQRRFRSAQSYPLPARDGKPSDEIVLISTVNPKKVGSYILQGSTNKSVELKGIRLDAN